MGLFPKDTDFGLTNAQDTAVREVFGAVLRKKAAIMKSEMRESAASGGERRCIRFGDGNGGEVRMMVHPVSYHYWGNRLGYQCWEDAGFVREYLRDNPEARVISRPEAPTVVVQGLGGLASLGAKRFSKTYGPAENTKHQTPSSRETPSSKLQLAAAVIAVLAILCAGCAHMPDTWNYTVQVDHQTGETSSYMGLSGPITYPWQKK